ncbi:hypothetical protein VKT23_019866 [Stygiomarasmius scandens]|uniref:Uncharacterized protein n=1 Tax=Marasmiellus scandens TaxID=2682957 RepID=A0ABR1IPM3_9AGAR
MASSVEASRASTLEDNTLPMASSVEISRVNSPEIQSLPHVSDQSSDSSSTSVRTCADTLDEFYQFPSQSSFHFQLISRLNWVCSSSCDTVPSNPLSTASDDDESNHSSEDLYEESKLLVTLSIIDDLYLRLSEVLEYESLCSWMDQLVIRYLHLNNSDLTEGDHFTHVMMPCIQLRDLQLTFWALQLEASFLSPKSLHWFHVLGHRLTKAIQWIDDFADWVDHGANALHTAYSGSQLLFQTKFLVTLLCP